MQGLPLSARASATPSRPRWKAWSWSAAIGPSSISNPSPGPRSRTRAASRRAATTGGSSKARSSSRSVAFDHKAHFADLKRGKQLRCTSCHSQIVQGQHITVTESSCFLCHFKKTENTPQVSACANCHKKDQLTATQARYNHTVVFDKNFKCDKCHSQVIVGDGAVPGKTATSATSRRSGWTNTATPHLIHDTHIAKNKIECTQCHLAIQHKIVKDIETIADCSTCHTGSHQAQKILYTGQGGKGVDHPMPNVMLEKGLSCKGCHMFHEETGGRLGQERDLDLGRPGLRILPRQRASARSSSPGRTRPGRSSLAINGDLPEGPARRSEGRPGPAGRGRERLLDEAAFNIDVVDRGKSVHNISYAQELLHAALEQDRAGPRGSPARPTSPTGSSFKEQKTPNACLNCHQGIDETTGPAFGLNFPHKKHVAAQNLACAKCHSNAKKHGELIAPKAFCTSCHHKDAAEGLRRPAIRSRRPLYQGGTIWARPRSPRTSWPRPRPTARPATSTRPRRSSGPTAAPCVECHDKTYDKTFADWRAGFRSKRDEVRAALPAVNRAALTETQKAELAAVEALLTALDLDGSSGVHNHAFADDALAKALAKIKSWGNQVRP